MEASWFAETGFVTGQIMLIPGDTRITISFVELFGMEIIDSFEMASMGWQDTTFGVLFVVNFPWRLRQCQLPGHQNLTITPNDTSSPFFTTTTMPSHNSCPPRLHGLSSLETEVDSKSKLKHTQKSQTVLLTPDFLTPTFESFLRAVTPAFLFLPLTVKILPGDTTDVVDVPIPPVPGNPIAYETAMTRLNDLVAEGTITIAQRGFLHAAMHTAQSFVRLGEVHSLLQTIASPLTPDSAIMEMASVVEAGINAFRTHPRPNRYAATTGPRNPLTLRMISWGLSVAPAIAVPVLSAATRALVGATISFRSLFGVKTRLGSGH